MIEIDIINGVPGLVQAADLVSMIPAWQEYIDRHLGPAWQLDPVKLNFAGNVKAAQPGHWWLVINGHSDQQGAMGYHAVQPNGLPYSRIFSIDDAKYGANLSVTATHELAEMLVNPNTDREYTIGNRVYAVEVCDAVEDDRFAFQIGDHECSDFVLPSYFDVGGAAPWDFQQVLAGPCPALTPGGYIGFNQNGIWHETFARLENGSQSYRSMRYGRIARRAAQQ